MVGLEAFSSIVKMSTFRTWLLNYKAILVAKGYVQINRFDFEELFSSIVEMTTLRILFTLTIDPDMKLHQMDVMTTFLHSNIEEE